MGSGEIVRVRHRNGLLGWLAESAFEWLPLGIFAIVWEILSRFVVGGELLPPFSAVSTDAIRLVVNGTILPHLAVSLFRVGIGLSISITVGVFLGMGMAQYERVKNFFDVLLTMAYAIPKTALVPLAILWLGVGTGTAVFVIFLGALVPIVLNTYNGSSSINEKLVWSAETMGTSDRALLRKVVVPATLPDIFTGIQQSIPLSFIVLISAEMVASRRGMGNLILSYGQLGNYDQMFAVIFIFSLTAFLATCIFNGFRAKVFVWD